MAIDKSLTIVVKDQIGRTRNIYKARGTKFSTSAYGYETLDFTLDQEFSFSWDDIGLNNQLFFYDAWGDTLFHGRVDIIKPTGIKKRGKSSNYYQAKGFRYSASDLKFSGTLIGTPEARIAAVITGGYMPQIKNDTTGLIATGIASGTTATDNSGTDDKAPWDVILDICKSGTSLGYKLIPQVWGDDRKLITRAINTVSPTPRYVVDRAYVAGLEPQRSLSDIYTQIEVRYKDSGDGSLQKLMVPSSTSATATALGVDLTGAGTITPFLRTRILDLTGIIPDGCDATTATNAGTAMLNEQQRINNKGRISGALTITRDLVIFDTLEGQFARNYKVRGGEWIGVSGMTPWPTEAGTGTSAGDTTIESMFFMSGTEYDKDNRTLSITPETASDLANAIDEKLAA